MITKKYTLNVSTGKLTNLLFIKILLLLTSPKTKHGGTVLPTKRKRFALIRSPHVNKKSKEHFQFVKYRRLFIISFTEKQLYEFLEKVPNDVEVIIKSRN